MNQRAADILSAGPCARPAGKMPTARSVGSWEASGFCLSAWPSLLSFPCPRQAHNQGVPHRTTHLEELKKLLPQCLLPDQVRMGQRLARALTAAHGGAGEAMPLERWIEEAVASMQTRHARGALHRHLRYPKDLPITARKDEIVATIRAHQVVVVAGETGSGKTTQLPKMCLEAGLGQRARIACTQPRRMAATSISQRVAEELNVEWGREIGCKIRFADHSRPETSVKFMTDGMLLAEVQGDPLLAEYEAVILDEAHERSLNIDFLLGYLKLLLARRDDLKLIITSATIDTERFARAFGSGSGDIPVAAAEAGGGGDKEVAAPIIEVSGRMFPVEVRYAPFDERAEEEGEFTFIDAAASAVDAILEEYPEAVRARVAERIFPYLRFGTPA